MWAAFDGLTFPDVRALTIARAIRQSYTRGLRVVCSRFGRWSERDINENTEDMGSDVSSEGANLTTSPRICRLRRLVLDPGVCAKDGRRLHKSREPSHREHHHYCSDPGSG